MALRSAFVSSLVSSCRQQQKRFLFAPPRTPLDIHREECLAKDPRVEEFHWDNQTGIPLQEGESHAEIAKLGMLDAKMIETFGTRHSITQSMAPYLRMIDEAGKKAPFTLSDETERDLLNGLEKVKPKEEYGNYKELLEDFLDRVIGVERGAGWEFEDTTTKRNEMMEMAEVLALSKGAGAVRELLKAGDMDAKLRRSLRELSGMSDELVFHSSNYRAPTKLFLRPTLKAQHRFMNRVYRACMEYGDTREEAHEKAVASNYVNMGSDWVRRSVEIDWDRKAIIMQLSVFNEDYKNITDLDLTADRRLHVGPLGMLSPSDRAIGNRVCNTIAHDPESISYLKFKHESPILPVFARQCILRNTLEYPMRGEWWNLFRNMSWPTSYIHEIAGRVEDRTPIAETLEF